MLLTAPLLGGRGEKSSDPLTAVEYRKLTQHLRERGLRPADLLTLASTEVLDFKHLIDTSRLERLLARGFSLSQAVERWQSRAIWVMSRADAGYPRALKARLREESPPVLYGCGSPDMLDQGGLAVVGSRNVDEALIEYAMGIGRLVAGAGRTLVSGGARGVDQASMQGALEAGGRGIAVLADSLEKAVLSRENRNRLRAGQLVLLSPYDPGAGFNVGNAMRRNKLIYALADAALVVNAEVDKGGTWMGASEQLDKLHLVPVYVRSTGKSSKGLDALVRKGATPWPDELDADGLSGLLAAPGLEPARPPSMQNQLPFEWQAERAPPQDAAAEDKPLLPPQNPNAESPAERDPAEQLYEAVRAVVLRVVNEPKRAAEVAMDLGVTPQQAERWLERLSVEGVLAKSAKPVRYSIRQTSLFDGTVDTANAGTRRAGSGG